MCVLCIYSPQPLYFLLTFISSTLNGILDLFQKSTVSEIRILKLFFFHFYYDLYSTHSDDSEALHDTKPTEDGDHHDHDEGDW